MDDLLKLYNTVSKHSNYQKLPPILSELLGVSTNQFIDRYEDERMNFLNRHIEFADKRVLDIGGNTGFFSFEAIREGAKEVCYIEGNPSHALFVEEAAKLLEMNINVRNEYLQFEGPLGEDPFDIVFLFNVIHHLGDDFGNQSISIDEAKKGMANAINYFYDKTETLVLQMGFCWKGNRELLLFENGTKREMIDFISEAIKDKWEVLAIGVAEEDGGVTSYNNLTEKNIERSDSLGEFRNRPILILKSISDV